MSAIVLGPGGGIAMQARGNTLRSKAMGADTRVPAGAVHAFGNDGPAPLRVLILHSPALDRYFAELDSLDRSGRLDRESEVELMRRHGLEPA